MKLNYICFVMIISMVFTGCSVATHNNIEADLIDSLSKKLSSHVENKNIRVTDKQCCSTTPVGTQQLIQSKHTSDVLSDVKPVATSLSPLDLSRTPTTDEIMAAGQLGGQLYPTHTISDPQHEAEINLSFGKAIQEWNKHEYKKAVNLFYDHIKQYPDSPWVAEAQLHVGCNAQYTGRYSEAEELFSKIITTYAGSATDGSKRMVHKARLRMGVLNTFQNNLPEAEKQFSTLMESSDSWRDRTYASHWLQRLSRYNTNKLALLNCGTLALAHLLEKDGKPDVARNLREILPTSLSGHSLEDIRELALKLGYHLTGYRMSIAGINNIPLPAIVQIQGKNAGDSGHYWVLEKVEGDRLELFDAQAGRIFSQSTQEFSKEWRGDILVLQDQKGTITLGQRLSDQELNKTYGGCCGIPRAPANTGADENNSVFGSVNSSGGPCGAPVWSVNMVSMNIYIHDIPLWYYSPVGPPVEISLSYNSQYSIAYHEPFGNKWQLNYSSYLVVDTGGQVTIYMPDGRLDIYSPNGQGGYYRPSGVFNTLIKLAENHYTLTLKDGMTYEYNIPSGTNSLQPFLVKIIDAHGKYLSMNYDANVRLISVTDALNRSTAFVYDAAGLITSVNDPFGRSASFEYTGTKLTKITDMGGYATNITYDPNVYIQTIGNSRGTTTFFIEPADGIYNGADAYPAPGSAMWGNYRITVTNSLNQKEEFYYNGYNAYSWHVSPAYYMDYPGNLTNANKTRYHFSQVNGFGQISSIDFPDGSTESYTYDTTTGLRNKITDAHGDAWILEYNSNGLLISTQNPRGLITTMSYTANGDDLVEIANGTIKTTITNNAYHQITSIKNRLGNEYHYNYNAQGQIDNVIDPLGKITTFTYYDETNQQRYQLKEIGRDGKSLMNFTYDDVGRLSTRTNATGQSISYAYDNLNRLITTTYPDGKQESYSYSGCCPKLLDKITDRAGRNTSFTYDAMQRLIEQTNPDGKAIHLTYDGNGNVAKLTDMNNNATTFEYDSMNRLIKKVDASGSSEDYTYDNAGLLKTRKGGRGITTNYTYDKNHNLTQVAYSDTTPTVTFTYDDFDRVTARTDGIGTQNYSYDVESRLTSQVGPWSTDTISYTYDDLNRLTSTQLQGAEQLVYTYDSLSRLTGIGVGTRQFTYAYPLDSASPVPLSLTRPNGSVTTFQNDVLNRLTELMHRKNTSELLSSYIYTFNAQDQRATESISGNYNPSTLNDSIVTYNYNNINQLLSSTNPERTYSYDADGNLTNGFTPSGYPFTATYDGQNRLKSLSYTDNNALTHSIAYHYAGDNFLSKIVIDGVESRFVRSGYSLLQERNATNSVTRSLVWDPMAPGGIGGLLEISQDTQLNYPLFDGKGNVVSLLDQNQNLAAMYTYDPFGVPLVKSGQVDQPYRFSTKRYDEATGLSYFGHRYFSPTLGRWLSQDPIGYKGGDSNFYGYVQNNPINFIDPRGLDVYSGVISGGGIALSLTKLTTNPISATTGIIIGVFDEVFNIAPNQTVSDLASIATGVIGIATTTPAIGIELAIGAFSLGYTLGKMTDEKFGISKYLRDELSNIYNNYLERKIVDDYAWYRANRELYLSRKNNQCTSKKYQFIK